LHPARTRDGLLQRISLADQALVSLGDAVTGIDQRNLRLVAIGHAAGQRA
jgi:hypothetical protein